MNILMLTCKKASELIDLKLVRKLTVKEKVMLRMHTSACDGCNAYLKQSKILDDLLLKQTYITNETKVPQITNDELKKQIISKL